MIKLIFICLSLLLPWPLHAQTTSTNGEHVTEYWQGKVLTASFRAGMCHKADGSAKGALILRHSNGQEDIYHLYGTIKNGKFDLSHSSGHHFYGELPDADTIKGKVKLARGMTLSLSGKRTLNARLKAEDCAPLN